MQYIHLFNAVIKQNLPFAGRLLVGSLININLVTILVKSPDKIISDHPGAPAFYIMPLNKMNQLPVFK